jgi:hypothetical protein
LTADTARTSYEQRRDAARADDARYDGWSALAGHGRVLLVFVAAIAGWIAWSRGTAQPLTLYGALGALAFVSFLFQDNADRRRDCSRLRMQLYEHALDRLDGRWRTFTTRGTRFDDAAHPFARDLDVLGNGSLFQLLDTTRTMRGEATLASWLMSAVTLPEVLRRREALQSLAKDLDARERLSIAGLDRELSRIDEEPLLAWSEGPDLFTPPTLILWAARILPFISVTTYFLAREGLIAYWPLWILATGHVALYARTRGQIEKIGGIAEKTEATLTRLLPLLEAAVEGTGATPMLVDVKARLAGAVEATASLRRRVTVFQSRANLIVAVISPIVLWDIHAAVFLQAWHHRYGSRTRGWFDALGALEALSALATYAYEHPDDAWPELLEGPARFEATGLGHPLLDASKCVRNDVTLSGPGTALLVTGSNMSGKSTLLRSVGLNVVMALTGLPVRAVGLRVSLVQVATSMRVSDSLQEGASFFLAEVRRLRSVVDLAHGSRPVLFLLDEILQGTNSRERSLGARGVIAHLVDAGAFGLVSTHDLSLARLGDQFHERIRYAHFSDQVDRDQMTFDYRLKPGVVQSSNALRLMRAMGLKVEVPDDG